VARTFCLLVLGATQALFCSDIFWFSYKIVTVNSRVIHEQKNIASAMIPYVGKAQTLCTIELVNTQNLPTEQFLQKHFDTILPCFYQLSAHLLTWDEQHLRHSNDRIEIVIEPVRFTVDFKDEFATINAIR
jgi:flagellar motility protein FlgQ